MQIEQSASGMSNSAQWRQSGRSENGDDEIQPALGGSSGWKRSTAGSSLLAELSGSAAHASVLVRLKAVCSGITQLDESFNSVCAERLTCTSSHNPDE